MHIVAEAILTHPELHFTCPKIWKIIHADYPGITIGAVSNCVTKKDTPILKLFEKTSKREGMATVYKRLEDAAMPLIVKLKTKTKRQKKIEPIPDTVTDIQIGQSIILYIEYLKNKIKELATAVGDMQAKYKSEINLSKMTLKQKDDTIQKLQEEIKSIRELRKTRSRTFNMGELLK
jgi:hypothetical protein